MAGEKERIYVEVSGASATIELRKDYIETFGGVDEVKKYVQLTLEGLMGDLEAPEFKEEIFRIEAEATRRKFNLLRSASRSFN